MLSSEDFLQNAIYTDIFTLSSLDRKDVEALIRLIHKEGAKGILSSINKADSLDSALLLLSEEEKERLMALHEAKKGASEGAEVGRTQSPASDDRKQA